MKGTLGLLQGVSAATNVGNLDLTDYTAAAEWFEKNYKTRFTLKTGEQRMLFRALVLGIMEYLNPHSKYLSQLEIRQNIEWIMSDNTDSLMTYASLCEIFKLPHDKLRRELVRMRATGETLKSKARIVDQTAGYKHFDLNSTNENYDDEDEEEEDDESEDEAF